MAQELSRIKPESPPLYVRAEQALSQLLRTSTPGEQLPPEPKMARMLGISRSTLREALRSFERQGLITRRRGIGTFVNQTKRVIESNLETLESLDTLLSRMGLECQTRDLEIREVASSPQVSGHLGIPKGSAIVSVSRTKTTGGLAVAYMHDVFPATLVSVDVVRNRFQGSAIDLLLELDDPHASYAWANISATPATADLASRLNIDLQSALLLMEETVYSTDHAVVEYSRNYFVPEYFNFHLVRRIAS
jgi:GntR family transcriptional regulator